MLGYSATIFAPIAAFFLINNWKDETKYNEQITCLTSIHSEIHAIKNQLDSIRNSKENYEVIKEIDIAFIDFEEKRENYVALHHVRLNSNFYETNKFFFEEKIQLIYFHNSQISLIKDDKNLNIFSDSSIHYLDNYLKDYLKTLKDLPDRVSRENVQHLSKEDYKKRRDEILEDMIFSSEVFYNYHKKAYHYISTTKKDELYGQLDKVLEQIYSYRSSLG